MGITVGELIEMLQLQDPSRTIVIMDANMEMVVDSFYIEENDEGGIDGTLKSVDIILGPNIVPHGR